MRERDIFIEALQKPSSDARAAYLHAACGPDAQLLGRVERLLLEHHRQESFILDSPATPLEEGVPLDPPALLMPPGTVIGRYKLLEPIGEGGYGSVFMAEQTAPVVRKVALKIIKAGMDTRQVIARFEAERQALALMDHPNIAKVFDAGVTDAGRPYFVMELVKGMAITKYCDEHHLAPRQRLELFVQVCQAVHHAHQKGIIHRDIKPTNVMVAQYDGKPVPKVIDFGVAKATGQKLTGRTMFTGFGDVIGTLEYMSPEQAEVNQLDVDTRSDIYSLGVLLYELLTGSTPLENKRVKKAALLEMLRVIREEEPPKPSTRLSTSEQLPSIAANRGLEPKKLSGLVHGELDWIVMKALEKDRGRRYDTANGFAKDVERYLNDDAVQACPPSLRYRSRKFVRRNRGPLTAAAGFAAVLVVATVFSTWQAVRATRALAAESAARRDADAAKRLAKTEAAIARAVNNFLSHNLLAQANPRVPSDRFNEPTEELKLLTVLRRASAQIDGRFPDQPLVEAALRQTMGQTFGDLGDRDTTLMHLERAVALRRTHLGDEHPDTLASMASLAWQKGDTAAIERLLEIRRRLLGQDDPGTLSSEFAVAITLDRRGEKAQAAELFRKNLAGRRRALGDDHPDTAWTKHLLACVERGVDGDVGPDGPRGAQIEQLFREALSTFQTKNGDGSWHTFDVTLRLGQFLAVPGHYERAEAVFTDGYRRLQAQPAAPPTWSAQLAGEMKALYGRWDKPERAAEWERRQKGADESALERYARLMRDQPDDHAVRASHASLLLQLKRYGDAEAEYRAAIRLHPQDASYHHYLGDACAGASRFGEAEAAYREAIRLDPHDGVRHHKLADALRGQGKLAGAAGEYAEAIRLRPDDHGSHYSLGSVHAFAGEWKKAAAAFEGAAKRAPDDIWSAYRWANLCFYTNDLDNYRRACRALLDRFDQTKNLQVADCAAKACALSPGFGGDADRVKRLADYVMTGTEADPARKWFEITKGLVDYRAGRFGPAADIILRSAPSDEGFHRDAFAFSILALAQHRQGRAAEAGDALASAQRIISTKMPKLEKGETFGDDWHDWLHAQVLCREADQLLNGPTASTQKSQ